MNSKESDDENTSAIVTATGHVLMNDLAKQQRKMIIDADQSDTTIHTEHRRRREEQQKQQARDQATKPKQTTAEGWDKSAVDGDVCKGAR